MRKKRLIIIISIILFCSLLIACTSKDNLSDKTKTEKIKLDFLVIPDQFIVYNTELVKELEEMKNRAKSNFDAMNRKYKDFSKMSEKDKKTQEKLASEMNRIYKKGQILDKTKTIENIFNQFRKIEGTFVKSFDSKDIYTMFHLNDDKETPFYANVDDSYYRQLILLKGGYIIIPKIVRMSDWEKSKVSYIKAKLPNNLVYELEKIIK
ncbi:MAG: hypothetical protein FH751_16435 [Firmicutes bacterium]|nr:hypothetical protein [Bacillota bacterium]